eukprot:1033266-Rhodomonas_salina.1
MGVWAVGRDGRVAARMRLLWRLEAGGQRSSITAEREAVCAGRSEGGRRRSAARGVGERAE